MKEINVLLYPQVTNHQGGPSNVVRYLSGKLNNRVNISEYPFVESSVVQNMHRYVKKMVGTWAKLGEGIDLIHFLIQPSFMNGSLLTALPAKVINIPIVLNIHGIIPLETHLAHKCDDYYPSSIQRFVRNSEALLCRSAATRIVVNSNFMFKKVTEWYGVDPEKIVVIPNGIDVKHFQECSNRVMLDGDPCVLYLGRLAFSKGVDTLIKALTFIRQDLPNIKVHCIGDSQSTDPRLKSMIAKEGLEKFIVFHRWVSQSTIPCYYKSADLCVFPSILESFGIVILEAMASGTPILGSDIAAYKELLKHETTGLFFKKSDPQDLKRALVKLASDKNLRLRLSENAQRAVQPYDWENVANKYLELYRNLVN